MKRIILLILLNLSAVSVFGQKEKAIKLGIINGRATYLPIPDYPQRAKDFCASGKVIIEVLINEIGNVIEAKAISGDELLIDSAIEAVKKAKFRIAGDGEPVKIRGIIVYNFPKEKNCILVERAVNNRAIYLPKPIFKNVMMGGKHLRLSKDEIVKVEIIIDEQGNVTEARAVSGHIILWQACEYAARKTKFSPTLDLKIKVKAFLIYTIKPNGQVEM